MLLSIDTSAGTSVAIVDLERGIIAERAVADSMRHAEVIGSLILACLDEAEVAPGELSGVVGGMGPGPFTGLRVGITAARTFALAISRPLVPVISHDAIAFSHYSSGGTGALLVVTDARRRELYWSEYSGMDDVGLPVRVGEPGLAKPDGVPAAVGARIDATEVSAGALGMVAELAFANGRTFAADEPLYLRSPDVTMPTGPKRVTR